MRRCFQIMIILLLLCSCTSEPVPISGTVRTNRTTRKTPNKKINKPRTDKNGNAKTDVMSGSQIFDKYKNAVFMIVISDGFVNLQGSGFFINSKGLAVSNYHVFNSERMGFEKIKIGNNCYNASRIVACSHEEDWVLFEVDGSGRDFSFIPLGEKNPKVGSKVYALGSPRGLENTFSSGEISQIRENGKILQISVPIDHGSSGGALINEYGQVVGITTAGIDDSGANLNFAYSIQLIKDYVK